MRILYPNLYTGWQDRNRATDDNVHRILRDDVVGVKVVVRFIVHGDAFSLLSSSVSKIMRL